MGKGREIQRGQSGEMGVRNSEERRHGERRSRRGMKDRQGKGEGDGRAPRLHRVGTARAETKREDFSN